MSCNENFENDLRKIEEVRKCKLLCCPCAIRGQTVATGDVIRSEYGMVVVVGPNNSSPAFVSLCKSEIITK